MNKIFIAGQKSFGAAVYNAVRNEGYKITGIACPNNGKYYDKLKIAAINDNRTPVIIDSNKLHSSDIPPDTDIIIAAHSHHFISTNVRNKVKHAIGYHPSLLPRHRGRDAVKWTIKFNEPIAGGTVYYLNDKVDGGDIINQEAILINRGYDFKILWKENLFPLGIKLILKTLKQIEEDKIISHPQDEDLSTWEPPIENRRLFRPELIMIE